MIFVLTDAQETDGVWTVSGTGGVTIENIHPGYDAALLQLSVDATGAADLRVQVIDLNDGVAEISVMVSGSHRRTNPDQRARLIQ